MSQLLRIKNNDTNEYITVKVNKYAVSYNKVWGSSVKNMEGSTRATLIGICPVIKATTDLLYQNDARIMGTLLNQSFMNVQYFDSLSGTIQDELYTASDVDIDMIRENGKWYEAINFTLTPIDTKETVS